MSAEAGIDVTVAPQGNVILLVGEHGKKIRVESAVLRCASPVFAAMFDPKFAEGQRLAENLANNIPTEIELPEDDFESMAILNLVLHHKVTIRDNCSSGEVLSMAIVADKYGYVDAVAMFASSCMPPSNCVSIKKLWESVQACRILKLPRCFAAATKSLLRLCGHDDNMKYAKTSSDAQFGRHLAWYLEMTSGKFVEQAMNECADYRDQDEDCEGRFIGLVGEYEGACLGCISEDVYGTDQPRPLHFAIACKKTKA